MISTFAVQEFVFPEGSVAVKMTVLSPKSSQSKVLMSSDNVTPHESHEPLSIMLGSIDALPIESSATTMSWHRATGEIVSKTVTLASHVLVFPPSSVSVRSTPNEATGIKTSEQSNMVS